MTNISTRAGTPADAVAIHALLADPEISLDRVAADLARPAIDLSRDTLLVHDGGGQLVASAWVHLGRRAQIHVHPRWRGQGLGARLLRWAEARAAEVGSSQVGQTVSDRDTAARELLLANGYAPEATQWRLEIVMRDEPLVPAPPEGITVRALRPGDERAAYQMMEKAFNEWQTRPREYEEWAQQTVRRPTFAAELSPLAWHGDRLVGGVLSLWLPDTREGYIDRVAVDRGHRNRGLARTLLAQAFQGFYRAGRTTCVLATHSQTGALALYERVGMTVRHSSTHYSKALRTSATPCGVTASATVWAP